MQGEVENIDRCSLAAKANIDQRQQTSKSTTTKNNIE
jgi:hypothetical protein